MRSNVPFGASNRAGDFVESYEKSRKAIEGQNPNALDKLLGGASRGAATNPSGWGDGAVVRDPWNREACVLPAVRGPGILQTKRGCKSATAVFGVT